MYTSEDKKRDDKIYYVYAWYYVDSGIIFHVGKGKNNRMYDTKNHRNRYFKNVIAKHANNVAAKKLFDNMTEKEALDKEREQIAYYKSIGQCKTNLHEGGCGGYTGNYDSVERSRKLSEAGKKRVGPLNPRYGKHLSDEMKERLRAINKGKKLTEEQKRKLSIAHIGLKCQTMLKKFFYIFQKANMFLRMLLTIWQRKQLKRSTKFISTEF